MHVHVEAVVLAGGEGGSHRKLGHATVILAEGEGGAN